MGCLPFWAPNVIELAHKIQSESYTPIPEDLELPDDLSTMLSQLLNKDPSKRCTLKDIASNNWVTRNGREPLLTTSKDNKEGLNATGFEITNAMSFARIVRLKTKVRRLVGKVRKNNKHEEEDIDSLKILSPTSTVLSRRSGTKTMVINGSSTFNVSTSLTSYRSTRKKSPKHSRPNRKESTYSYEAVSETGVSSSSDDDDDDDDFSEEEVVLVEDGNDLDSHLSRPKRARRRYSEVIPGRVDLTGIIAMRRDCVNLALRFVCSTQSAVNGRESMEDRHISIATTNTVMNLPPNIPPIAYFGVYDGHSGSDCAEFIRLNLHQHIFDNPAELLKNPEQKLIKAYEDVDKLWLQDIADHEGQMNYSGSTAVSVMLWENKIIVASVGDSRAVLARQGTAIDLTIDHIPTLQSETERIHRAGGSIVRGRVQGVLAISRAFGDIEYKTLKEKSWGLEFTHDLVIPTPAVKVIDIVPEDEFVIIASDGLFDVFSSQRTIGRFKIFLNETGGNVDKSLKMLVDAAVEMRPGHDNITVTVVMFTDVLSDIQQKSSDKK